MSDTYYAAKWYGGDCVMRQEERQQVAIAEACNGDTEATARQIAHALNCLPLFVASTKAFVEATWAMVRPFADQGAASLPVQALADQVAAAYRDLLAALAKAEVPQ